jgi:acetyl-CoA C-acetyltransferase
MNRNVYIINYKRTPICSFLSQLSSLNAIELGSLLVNEISKDINKEDIKIAYIGNVLSSGLGQNIAKQITYNCDINCPSITINRVCSSGLQSIIEGYKSILLNETELALVGGTESMSNSPYLTNKIRQGNKYGNIDLCDSMLIDGLTDPFSKKHMGELTEELIEELTIEYDLNKNEFDEYAKQSYLRARETLNNCDFNNEILEIKNKNNIIKDDEEINKNPDLNKINKLNPVFKKNGLLTAGNSSKLSDGACMMLLASEEYIKKNNIKPIAKIINYSLAADKPKNFTVAPVKSIKDICIKENIKIEEIDYFEINEAFPIVPIMCNKILKIPYDKMNVFGGAIALGHPLGCSGARIVGTLMNVLKKKGGKIGCASICNGGGGATSILIELI